MKRMIDPKNVKGLYKHILKFTEAGTSSTDELTIILYSSRKEPFTFVEAFRELNVGMIVYAKRTNTSPAQTIRYSCVISTLDPETQSSWIYGRRVDFETNAYITFNLTTSFVLDDTVIEV